MSGLGWRANAVAGSRRPLHGTLSQPIRPNVERMLPDCSHTCTDAGWRRHSAGQQPLLTRVAADLGWADLGWAGLGWAGLGWADWGWADWDCTARVIGWAGVLWAPA